MNETIERFENGTLTEGVFNHAGHIKMAFLYLRAYKVTEVLERFPAALVRFATAKGKPGLYHETITWAFVLLIHERMRRAGSQQSWSEFANENQDLLKKGKGYLEKYYRPETMGSELAKTTFVFPDRAEVTE
jgi:hypothetical protein